MCYFFTIENFKQILIIRVCLPPKNWLPRAIWKKYLLPKYFIQINMSGRVHLAPIISYQTYIIGVFDNIPVNCLVGCDICIYHANDPKMILRDLKLTWGVTNANFYTVIEIFCIFKLSYILQSEDKTVILKNNN